MRDRHDRDTRLALGRAEQRRDIQRRALEPRRETRRRDEVVDRKRELLPLLLRVEGLEVHDADAPDGWLLDLRDERREVEALPQGPCVREDGGEQHVLAALDRIGVDADEAEQTRDGRADALAQQLAVITHLLGRRGERRQDRYRDAGIRSRRIDREVGGGAKPAYAFAVLPPRRESVLPRLRLLRGVRVRAHALLRRILFIDPGAE